MFEGSEKEIWTWLAEKWKVHETKSKKQSFHDSIWLSSVIPGEMADLQSEFFDRRPHFPVFQIDCKVHMYGNTGCNVDVCLHYEMCTDPICSCFA